MKNIVAIVGLLLGLCVVVHANQPTNPPIPGTENTPSITNPDHGPAMDNNHNLDNGGSTLDQSDSSLSDSNDSVDDSDGDSTTEDPEAY